MNNNAVITGVLLILVFIVGFGLGRITAGPDGFQGGMQELGIGSDRADTQNEADASSQTGTTVNTSNLTDSQRSMIEALGIDADSITITPAMIACAEAELGAARIEEIKNGATPSFSEGAKLVACYR